MVGWVYESNRDKKKQAQRDLDKFYADDLIEDLGKTRDAELEILQDRIDAWDLYLKNLEWYMKQQEREHNLHILEALMGAQSEEEIRDSITKDMETFNQDALQNYKDYNTIFYENLIVPYKQNLDELQIYYEQMKEILDINSLLGGNNGQAISGIAGGQGVANFGGLGYDPNRDYSSDIMKYISQGNLPYDEFQKLLAERELKALAEGTNISGTANGGYISNKELEDLYHASQSNRDTTSSTYDIGSNGSKNKVTGGGSSGNYASSGVAQSTVDDYVKNLEAQAAANSAAWHTASDSEKKRLEQANKDLKAEIDRASGSTSTFNSTTGKWTTTRKGYADGLDSGPVTYTGLAMLHGTPSTPEYVVNSDQAYNMLHLLGAGKLPETVNNDNGTKTSYIVQGDVILESCDNPAEFWKDVTNAMTNRWNVTKNNKG